MARNRARRDELLDSALAVLAEQGARGLTFRAVDTHAGAPIGTASNYFSDRDTLLADLGEHVHRRLAPTDAELAVLAEQATPPDTRLPAVMRGLVERVLERRTVYLALLELRLEATRRPALRASLTGTLRRMFQTDLARHDAAGLPGGAETVVLLHHAMEGLVLDQLTLPEALGDDRDIGSVAENLAAAILQHQT